MFKVLEPKPQKIKDDDKVTAAKCTCICKAGQAKAGPQQPEGNLSGVEVGVHYDITG